MKRIGIVGGGISGLACAYECQKQNLDFVLFEQQKSLGGVLGTSVVGGAHVEHAANGFLGSLGGAIDLCNELNVPLQKADPKAKIRRLYLDGKLVVLPNGPKGLLGSKLLSWKAKGRLAVEPFVKRGNDLSETVHDLLRRRLGKESANLLSPLLVTGIFAGDPKRLEASSAFPWLSDVDKSGGIFKNAIARAKDHKNNPIKGMQAPTGGVGDLLTQLRAELTDDRVMTGTMISTLEKNGQRFTLIGENDSYDCDLLVLATPARVSSKLVCTVDSELSVKLGELNALSLTVVSFLFNRGSVEAFPFDGYGFLVHPNQDLSMCGTVFESSVWQQRSPDDTILVRCMMGGVRDKTFIDKSEDECIEVALTELNKITGETLCPLSTFVKKWPNGIPQYETGHGQWADVVCTKAEKQNMHLIGASYGGVSVNDCIKNARKTAVKVASLCVVILLCVFGACSGSDSASKKEHRLNKPAAHREVVAIADHEETMGGQGGVSASVNGQGRLSITPSWLWPHPKFRDDQKVNACGASIRPTLAVHVMGGMQGALVEVEGIESTQLSTELVIRQCKPTRSVDTVQVGGKVLVANHDERAHKVWLEKHPSKARSHFYLNGLGQTVELLAETEGLWKIWTEDDPLSAAWIRISKHIVLLTDERGTARLWDVPAGRYKAVVYHPPVSKNEPLVKDVSFTVEANKTTAVSLPMKE